MSKREKPEEIPMTEKELKDLLSRIKEKKLEDSDFNTIEKLIHFIVWMQMKLQSAQMTMRKFRDMIFGGKTEKHKKKKKDNEGSGQDKAGIAAQTEKTNEQSSSTDTSTVLNHHGNASNETDLSTSDPLPDEHCKKGHGKHAADEYTPDEVIDVKHDDLNPGDPCPTQCGGRLYSIPITPGGIIRIYGQSSARIVSYRFHRLRCALCGDTLTPPAPPEYLEEKYNAHFKAILVLHKYFLATPFYRQARFQDMLSIPLAATTQWDLVESVGDCAYPVFFALEGKTANGENIEHDDTHVKIQDVMKDNKLNPDKERTGMYTTCIKGTADGHSVCLYYTGTQHGGENVSQLLSKRDTSLPPIRQMCDALAANVAKEYKTILCNCLTHGRRKFKEIELDFPEECDYVLEQFGQVYKHDATTKALNMSAIERLVYHQEHSLPVMNNLWDWMQKQFADRLVEPNCGLGKAIKYMKNHWEKLTRFLSVAGALIDNNLVEQALKLIIRIRKNSMFHKSEHGAFIAAMLLSLIATCELAGKNPVHYLTELQKNKSSVFKQPHLWFPWNYEATIHDTEQITQQAAA